MRRIQDKRHLQFIRTLPCISCMVKGEVTSWSEAAHLRSGSLDHDKRQTGMAEKPSDEWVLPLCTNCHRIGPDSQHAGAELVFWEKIGINPFDLAIALYGASGDRIKGNSILGQFAGRAWQNIKCMETD